MTRYFATAALALVLVAGGAAAQAPPQNDQNGQEHPHQNAGQGQVHRPNGQHNQSNVQAGGAHNRGPAQAGQHGAGQAVGAFNSGSVNTGQRVAGQAVGGVRANNRQFRQHALRGRDQGRAYYRPGAFQQHVTATRRFHVTSWSRPAGWYYRSWTYGMFLPAGWYASPYYLNWALYGLPPPPIGCEWVRNGPDALLVDIWTGEILSVYSGVFY